MLGSPELLFLMGALVSGSFVSNCFFQDFMTRPPSDDQERMIFFRITRNLILGVFRGVRFKHFPRPISCGRASKTLALRGFDTDSPHRLGLLIVTSHP